MTRVLLITTGGTIASRRTTIGIIPTVSGSELASRLAEGLVGVDVEVDEYCDVQSYALSLADQFAIAQRAVRAITEFDGVVVTHGTDTVADTAWLTHLVLGEARGRIAFATAMIPDGNPGAEGIRNLIDAGRFAVDAAAQGVVVVTDAQVHSAAWVVKTHTTAVSSLQSPGRGPVADFFTGDLRQRMVAPSAPAALPVTTLGEVAVVPVWAGYGDTVIDSLVEAGVAGIVVEGTGAGNVAPSGSAGIERALAAGVVVAVTSRAAGPTHSAYAGGPGSGAWLAEHGVWATGDLSSARAQIALAVALGGEQPAREWFNQVAGVSQ